MLHSFSHLLITSIALECGYPASSIRERVYARPGTGFGLLLYTGSSDSEGTLGDLIQVGRRIHDHFRNALTLGELCSNDPVCVQHRPQDAHERRFLHGATCHGCLLISATSCERQNDFLVRALVVPTVENLGAEFFWIYAVYQGRRVFQALTDRMLEISHLKVRMVLDVEGPKATPRSMPS